MNRAIRILCFLTLISVPVLSSCAPKSVLEQEDNEIVSPPEQETNNATATTRMKIIIGSNIFSATLMDNKSAEAFKSSFPIVLDMNELNQNEKFCNLPSWTTLPTNPSNPGTIRNGDLMLYGNNCIVLFYKTFNTSYSYTRLGKVDNPSNLADVLGSGNCTVRFELE